MTNDFGEVLLWSFWFFIWIAALMVWFRFMFDVARSRSMTERQVSKAKEIQAARSNTSSRSLAPRPRQPPVRHIEGQGTRLRAPSAPYCRFARTG
jgi:hypothetical protein